MLNDFGLQIKLHDQPEEDDMATQDEIKRLIGEMGSNPTLMDELLQARDENARKKVLTKHGLVKASEKGPTKQQVKQQISQLLKGATAHPVPEPGERLVEWVAAIATAAAGAAAGACTADS
jgi:hypothetical protein